MVFEYYDFNIDFVSIENFRRFSRLEVELDRSVTALTAPNGGGKSAILQALAIGCAHFVNSFNVSSGISGVAPNDHRLVHQLGEGMTPAPGEVRIVCKGNVGDTPCEWSRERACRPNSKTRFANAQCLQSAALKIMQHSAASDRGESLTYPIAPLVLFYDTERLSSKQRLTEKRKPQRADRFEGYGDSLTSGSYINIFKDWYKALSFQLLQENPMGRRYEIIKNQLAIVNNAVSVALTHVGWKNLRWDFIRNDLSLEHSEYGSLCFSQLSDGIRNILNLVADIVHRAVRINPLAPADLLSYIKGLVLIDEIDMYLHPEWQQQIIRVFRDLLPNVQFVISTHSPQVLSTLKKNQIRVIMEVDGEFYAEQPSFSPYAHSSANALAEIFGVNPIPKVIEDEDIVRVQQLYRNGRFAEAERLKLELAQKGVYFKDADVAFWKFCARS